MSATRPTWAAARNRMLTNARDYLRRMPNLSEQDRAILAKLIERADPKSAKNIRLARARLWAWYARLAARFGPVDEPGLHCHECQYCDGVFAAKRPDARYCSPACRSAMRNLRRRKNWAFFLAAEGFVCRTCG